MGANTHYRNTGSRVLYQGDFLTTVTRERNIANRKSRERDRTFTAFSVQSFVRWEQLTLAALMKRTPGRKGHGASEQKRKRAKSGGTLGRKMKYNNKEPMFIIGDGRRSHRRPWCYPEISEALNI